MKKRYLRISLIIVLILVVFSIQPISSQEVTINNQASCEMANAEWQYISPENAESRFECVCEIYEQGIETKTWNGTACILVTDEMRCIKTQGVWKEDKCECAKGGIWVLNVGCRYVVHDSNYLIIILLIIVSIAIIILLIILIKILLKNSKKRRKNGE